LADVLDITFETIAPNRRETVIRKIINSMPATEPITHPFPIAMEYAIHTGRINPTAGIEYIILSIALKRNMLVLFIGSVRRRYTSLLPKRLKTMVGAYPRIKRMLEEVINIENNNSDSSIGRFFKGAYITKPTGSPKAIAGIIYPIQLRFILWLDVFLLFDRDIYLNKIRRSFIVTPLGWKRYPPPQ
jgi:hypothetical protein